MISIIKFLLVLVFLIIGAAFSIINDGDVNLDLYFHVTEMPLSLVILLSIGVGIVLGGLASLSYMATKKH